MTYRLARLRNSYAFKKASGIEKDWLVRNKNKQVILKRDPRNR